MAIATRPKSEPKPSPSSSDTPQTLADLLARLGGVPASRVRYQPPVGTATEADLLAANDRPDRTAICELVDGVLVEKPVGKNEGKLTAYLIMRLMNFVEEHRLGEISTPDGPFRLAQGLVRLPDIAFVAVDRDPANSIYQQPPDLAVEILSESNRSGEMRRKLREYFESGVKLYWVVDPKKSTVTVYEGPKTSRTLRSGDTLDGGTVLPGFTMPLGEIFPRYSQKRK